MLICAETETELVIQTAACNTIIRHLNDLDMLRFEDYRELSKNCS